MGGQIDPHIDSQVRQLQSEALSQQINITCYLFIALYLSNYHLLTINHLSLICNLSIINQPIYPSALISIAAINPEVNQFKDIIVLTRGFTSPRL